MLKFIPCQKKNDCWQVRLPDFSGRPSAWARIDLNPSPPPSTEPERRALAIWRLVVVVLPRDMPGRIRPGRERWIHNEYAPSLEAAKEALGSYLSVLESGDWNALKDDHKWKTGLVFDRDRGDVSFIRCQGIGPKCVGTIDDPYARGVHTDHIVPRVRGGSHALANLQLLCSSCNSSKGSRPVQSPLKAPSAPLSPAPLLRCGFAALDDEPPWEPGYGPWPEP